MVHTLDLCIQATKLMVRTIAFHEHLQHVLSGHVQLMLQVCMARHCPDNLDLLRAPPRTRSHVSQHEWS